jgi:hypothetical protein
MIIMIIHIIHIIVVVVIIGERIAMTTFLLLRRRPF